MVSFRTTLNQKFFLFAMMYGYRNEAYEGILKRIEFTSLDKSKYSGIWNVLRTMSLKHIGNQNFAEQSYATMAEHELLSVFREDTQKYLEAYLRSNVFSEQINLVKLNIDLSKVQKSIKKTFPLKIEHDKIVPSIQISESTDPTESDPYFSFKL